MLPHVPGAREPEADGPDPPGEAEARRRGNENEPEPEEDEDLLVEEVDGEDALDGVSVDVAHLVNLEVAERDLRKASRRHAPRRTRQQVVYDLDPVQVVLVPEERVQHE